MTTMADLIKTHSKQDPELSFSRMDIEKRLGCPAGRHTAVGPVLAPLLGIIMTVAFFGILAIFPETVLAQMLTQRGPVQYAIVLFTLCSAAIIGVKYFKMRLQRKALKIRLLPPDDPGFVLTPDSAAQVLKNLYTLVDDPDKFVLTKRIHNALSNLRNIRRIGDVSDVLSTEADSDEGAMESSYTFVRGLIWAIPVLGFIGTVMGLSVALGSFWGVIASAENMEKLRSALQQVTGGLSTAFETTLVGLVAALFIHLFMIAVKHKEERFLDECRDYCQKHIVSRLKLSLAEKEGSHDAKEE
jgi:biopolymer transport protein ExbB/TolQ